MATWEPTLAYPEHKASVIKDIAASPYLAVLQTTPNAGNAEKVRNILREAMVTESEQGQTRFGSHDIMARAHNRAIWAAKWLEACGEPTASDTKDDIGTHPHMAVLASVPHPDRADEVRFLLQNANADAAAQRLEREGCHERLMSAENRAACASAWLRGLEE